MNAFVFSLFYIQKWSFLSTKKDVNKIKKLMILGAAVLGVRELQSERKK